MEAAAVASEDGPGLGSITIQVEKRMVVEYGITLDGV